MNKKIVGILVCTLIIICLFNTGSSSKNERVDDRNFTDFSETDWWLMFKHDSKHSGFSTSQAPNTNSVLWQHTISMSDGILSSPIIYDNRIYISANKLYCLNADTGDLIWNSSINVSYVFTSPIIYENYIYIIDANNTNVYCLNVDSGDEEWNFTCPDPYKVTESNIVVTEGNVFLGMYNSDNYDEGIIYCLDAENGEFIWSIPISIDASCSPSVTNGKLYFSSTSWHILDSLTKVYCLDASNGSQIWNFTISDGISGSTPAVVGEKVYINILKIIGYNFDARVFCLDALNGNYVWDDYIGTHNCYSSPTVVENKVFIGATTGDWPHSQGVVRCFNAETGSSLWNCPLCSGELESSPSVADGKVYIGSTNGIFYCLDAETGSKKWNYQLGDSIISTAAIADGKVTIGSIDGVLYCFEDEEDTTPPSITITRPKNGLYIFDRKILPLSKPIIFGKITVEATVTDDESGVEYVAFAICKDFPYQEFGVDDTEPYSSLCEIKHFGKTGFHVCAVDNAGNYAEKLIEVWKFF